MSCQQQACTLQDKIRRVEILHPAGDPQRRGENTTHFACMARKLMSCNFTTDDPRFSRAHQQCEAEGVPFYGATNQGQTMLTN